MGSYIERKIGGMKRKIAGQIIKENKNRETFEHNPPRPRYGLTVSFANKHIWLTSARFSPIDPIVVPVNVHLYGTLVYLYGHY